MGVSCPAIDGGVELVGEDECGAGEIRYYSSRGPSVDLAAPGAGIWAPKYLTAAVGNQEFALPRPGESDPLATANNKFWYGKFGGTSAAAPYVSGVIALMLEANPRLRPAQIEAILKGTARDFGPHGWDTAWGFGEVNAFAAAVAAWRSRR